MKPSDKLRAEFDANWTTMLVGWTGLGVLSPWPKLWTDFPSLVTRDELESFADERRCLSTSPRELYAIEELLALLKQGTREEVRDWLQRLSSLRGGDEAVELRKWRLTLLEEVLAELPPDVVHGLAALSEFWQSFGFPTDSPHVIQGRGNALSPSDYYREETLRLSLERHRSWIQNERLSIRAEEAKRVSRLPS